jgi:ribose 5-phosphate isomerase B
MKIYIASDHGGYELKENLKPFLLESGFEVVDKGNTKLDQDDDYPDFVIPLAEEVSQQNGLGIVIGRTGAGEAIAANKVKGVRAVVCMTKDQAQKAREKNHANVLALGADYIDISQAKEIVNTFIETQFSDEERHTRRVNKITSYESSNS